jgi:hypothetical protein
MWKKQTDSLVKTSQNQVAIRFNCPKCGTLNTIDDISIPEFSDMYDKSEDSDESEIDERECSNDSCKHNLEIEITNGVGGFIVQVEAIANNDIEYEL